MWLCGVALLDDFDMKAGARWLAEALDEDTHTDILSVLFWAILCVQGEDFMTVLILLENPILVHILMLGAIVFCGALWSTLTNDDFTYWVLWSFLLGYPQVLG
jgi:hypothetical protein